MSKNKFPELVPGIPFFGNILKFMKSPRDYFIDMHKHYGEVFRVKTPLGYVSIICGKVCKELINNETENGLTRKGLFKAFSTEVGVDIFEEADEEHKKSHRFVQLPYSRLVTAQFVPHIVKSVEDNLRPLHIGQEQELFQFCTEITLNAVMTTISPIRLDDITDSFFPYADRVMDIITQKFPHFTSYFPLYRRNKMVVHERIDEVIRRHAVGEFKGHSEMYVTDAILKNLDGGFSEEHIGAIRGILIYLLAGSVVYTSRLVFFLFFEILKNKQLRFKVLSELGAAFGKGKIDSSLFRRMPYFRSSYLETLRLFPLLPGLPFQTTREVHVNECILPKGEKIIFVPHSEHFLEKNYPNPYQFDPERFHARNKNRFIKDAFVPYGVSKRTCAAIGSSEVLVLTIVATLLRKKKWAFAYDSQGYELKLNPLIGPDRPIPIIHKGDFIERRKKSRSEYLGETFDFEPPFENIAESSMPEGELVSYPEHDFIINQGELPDAFYIMTNGKVEVLVDGKKVAELKEGDSFGEIGLLKDIPRTASIKTLSPVSTIRFSKDEFIKYTTESDLDGKEFTKKFQRHYLAETVKQAIPRLGVENLKTILDDFQYRNVSEGDTLIKEGDPAQSFYFIILGKVGIFKKSTGADSCLAKLSRGEIFGELGIINEYPRSATVKALTETAVLEINRKVLVDLLNDSHAARDDILSLVLRRINSNISKKGD